MARDVAAFQLQAPLDDVHTEAILFAADLAKSQVGDPADVGLEQQHAGVAGLHCDVLDWAVPQYLQWLVDH